MLQPSCFTDTLSVYEPGGIPLFNKEGQIVMLYYIDTGQVRTLPPAIS